uniref:RING-type domain-containing protein n=1 Tax=Kalanchoe fedtschenkoi TaxID=63787 RepID=A0A7N0VDX6_KALFE
IAAVVGIVLISIISYVVVSLRSHTDDAGGGSETSGNEEVTQEFDRENPMTVFRGGANGECSICLDEFEEEDQVRKLSGCGHQFHATCVDRWVASRSRQPSCPTCRGQIV